MELIIFLTLMALGYGVGTLAEKMHYRSIRKREKTVLAVPLVTMRSIPYPAQRIQSVRITHGSAVISVDYFKRILAKLRNVFGGRVKSYESLIDRARREALLRMRAEAPDADIFVNVRIETSAVGKFTNKKNVTCLEALAYGTAVVLTKK